MKKLTVFCLILGIFFTSCTSKVFVTKRLYRDGHYVSYNNGKSNIEPIRSEKLDLPNKTEQKSDELIQNEALLLEIPVIADQGNTERNTALLFTADVEKLVDNTISLEPIQQKLIGKDRLTGKPFLQIKQKKARLNASNTFPNEGYSLLWIVVLIVLLLWALGHLAGGLGLGGLINILLVIALVLLILWLLRVV